MEPRRRGRRTDPASAASLPPFDAVVVEHGPVVLRVCRALLGPIDAEDAWSETFLAALRAYPGLPPGSNVRGWLVTIAYRKGIDAQRRAGRAPDLPADLPDAGTRDSPTAVLADEDLRRAVAALPPKQRAAVVYRHLAGLPYAEVADLLDCSEVAARRSAADGIAALRRAHPWSEGR